MPKLNSDQTVHIEKLLLKGARILDSAHKLDETADILIQKDTIQEISSIPSDTFKGTVLDCAGLVVAPGFCDMHVHLREPGREDKETIETGCAAAAAGGFTAVACMPNTKPPLDNRSLIEFVQERAEYLLTDVHPVAAITKGLKGEELTEMGELAEAGAVAFSDDGRPVFDSDQFRRALEYAGMFNRPIIEHSEELSLAEGGHMNEGFVSTQLGLKGIPPISEDIAVARNVLIAEYVGKPVHIAHVSTAGSVRIIREAKSRGVPVTAETCPHYLIFTDEMVKTFDPNKYKMNPPLRTEADRLALLDGLKDGTIDAIATDHAPHTIDDKDCEFDVAAFGIIGLETSIGSVLSHLVQNGKFKLPKIIELMSVNPRKILGLDPIEIKAGARANLTVFDPKAEWTVDPTQFKSKGRNTPFDGETFTGKAVAVLNKGMVYLGR
ncbi:dihydroorotase [candidate division KSB1 bacterium]|nr:dihydroorotase [candidate division KSB1 bacterium]